MFPQPGFEDCPLGFTGVQIGRIRGQIFQVTTFTFDESLGAGDLWKDALSIKTVCPGRRSGPSACSSHALNTPVAQ
jgi:hypothetical protein